MKDKLVVLFLAVIEVGLAMQCLQEQGEWKELVLQHEDCDKFYKCTSEGAVTMSCPGGLYFNTATSRCDWKQNVNCSKENSLKDEEIGSKEIDNSEMEDFEEENKPVEPSEIKFLENGCPVDHDVHWLLPDENNCNTFYYCVRGQKIRRSCPSNLHFNHKLQVCDWPEVAGCAKSSEDNATEEKASDENKSEEEVSQEDNSEVDTSEIDTSEINTSEINTSEINTSEINTSEINTSDVDTSEIGITEDTSEDNSQVDNRLMKTIEADVNVKLLNFQP